MMLFSISGKYLSCLYFVAGTSAFVIYTTNYIVYSNHYNINYVSGEFPKKLSQMNR